MKNKIFTYFAQKTANFIIERLQKSNNQKEFDFWYNQGLFLNTYCQNKGVYLN